jgi:hypothetical protein
VTDHSHSERRQCEVIRLKEQELRSFLAQNVLDEALDARKWLKHLESIKHRLGNLNNDISFVATLLIKEYLAKRFGIVDFDASAKAQGAPGIDIEVRTIHGVSIVGELKTTRPYQPGFGAAQRASILKDLNRLSNHPAEHRIMFVIDDGAYKTLCTKSFAAAAKGVEIVNLSDGTAFVHPA